jgi:two-component system aerobic respiration control sensor histidine kinase ArcB
MLTPHLTPLCRNSIKYTGTGSITLKLGWEDKDTLRFECEDTGPGIPKHDQEKLFQRFVQRGGEPGTGLGLAIAKHLVELIGGSIFFESDPSVKVGTNCIVILPLPPCDAPVQLHCEETTLDVLQDALKVLLIDDIKMNRTMLRRRIMKGIAPNCIFTEASTGEEALEICAKSTFDVIVVDQYMQEAGGMMVGTDVVCAMRQSQIESIIIGCSGNDIDDLFLDAGADWVWKKPMPSNKKILSQLHGALREKKLHGALREKKEYGYE